MSVFEGLRTVVQLDQRYKEEFAARGCATNADERWRLQELHRKAHEQLTDDRQADARSASSNADPNRIRPRELRNWAAQRGIPLAKKGRVSLEVENEYRRAHNLPELAGRPAKVSVVVDAPTSVVRSWAQEHGFEVGSKGRLRPEVLSAYAEAHSAT